MAKNTQPIAKRCKALGISPAVMGYAKKNTTRNSNGNFRKKKSEYATQMQAKQKLKFIYGVLEKQFSNYFEEASRRHGQAGETLLQLLECRLDNVVFRLGFARTRKEARQMVTHGHICVNGRRVDIPSFRVRPGELVSVAPKAKELLVVKSALVSNERVQVPAWLEIDIEKLQGSVLSLPTRDQIDLDINEQLIVELYSK